MRGAREKDLLNWGVEQDEIDSMGSFLHRSIDEIERTLLSIVEHGVVGKPTTDPRIRPTYLKTYALDGCSVRGSYDGEMVGDAGGLYVIRFHIDTAKLLEVRDLYADPENLWSSENPSPEYGNTFILFGGIPVNAVRQWNVWHPGREEPPKVVDLD